MSGTPDDRTALLVVDVQRDFCPGGALPAPGGDQIIPALNQHLRDARARGWTIYASRDWHPPVTTHFAEYGGQWPPHCVMNTPGAQFHPDLELPTEAIVVTKGGDPQKPGYSSFDGITPDGRSLADDLRARGIKRVFVMGLTAEYCVKETTLDALREGFRASVLTDAVAGINQKPGDAERAEREMQSAGAELAGAIDEPAGR